MLCNEPQSEKSEWFCQGCIEKLAKNSADRDACPRCSHNRKIKECSCDLAWDHYFEQAFSFFDFDETVQDIAHQVKYKGKKDLARYVGREYACLIPDTFIDGVDGVLCVPLHFLRKMNRGYNQADYLAQGVIRGISSDIPYMNKLLYRTRNTKTQTKLDKEQRQKNLANAFAVYPKKGDQIRGKKLILVDDVITTGATTDLCTKVLLDAGAEAVRVLSLART